MLYLLLVCLGACYGILAGVFAATDDMTLLLVGPCGLMLTFLVMTALDWPVPPRTPGA